MGHPVIALSCGYWLGWDYITMIKLRTWPSEIKAATHDPAHSLNASSNRPSEGSDYCRAAPLMLWWDPTEHFGIHQTYSVRLGNFENAWVMSGRVIVQ